jgi:hypothetical protein
MEVIKFEYFNELYEVELKISEVLVFNYLFRRGL